MERGEESGGTARRERRQEEGEKRGEGRETEGGGREIVKKGGRIERRVRRGGAGKVREGEIERGSE